MTRFENYQKYQTWYEVGVVGVFLLLNSLVLATTRIMDSWRSDEHLPFLIWEPFTWEFSSALMTMFLLPLIVWFLNSKFSTWRGLAYFLFTYLSATVVFSVLHICGMVTLRKLVYWSQNLNYDFGDPVYGFIYEYRKDLISFILIVGVLQVYRFVMSRLQGEANIVMNGEADKLASFDRILVRKLGKEFIVKIADVEWMESSGNYVNLQVNGRVYPIRNTLSKLVQSISDKGFCRIHRSYAVNLDEVESIEAQTSGSSELRLKSGKVLNLSRRYYDELKQRLH